MTSPFKPTEKLLTTKELAAAIGHHRNYIHAMKRKGFIMPGNRATLGDALEWLARNPAPRSDRPFQSAA